MPRSRRLPGRYALLLLLAAGAGAAGFLALRGDEEKPEVEPRAEDQDRGLSSAERAIREGLIELDLPETSIGELIDRSALIIRGTVVDIAEPRWNSPDGSDWHEEFEGNPEQYDTVPLPLTQVTIAVEEVLDWLPESEAPEVVSGEEIVVEFLMLLEHDVVPFDLQEQLTPEELMGFLSPGDERIFFIEWRPFPVPVGVGPRVWRGDTAFGTWGIDEAGRVFPASFDHNYSLQTALERGEAEVVRGRGIRAAISVQELRRLIGAERETPDRATVASYEQWPWEPAYEASFTEED